MIDQLLQINVTRQYSASHPGKLDHSVHTLSFKPSTIKWGYPCNYPTFAKTRLSVPQKYIMEYLNRLFFIFYPYLFPPRFQDMRHYKWRPSFWADRKVPEQEACWRAATAGRPGSCWSSSPDWDRSDRCWLSCSPCSSGRRPGSEPTAWASPATGWSAGSDRDDLSPEKRPSHCWRKWKFSFSRNFPMDLCLKNLWNQTNPITQFII